MDGKVLKHIKAYIGYYFTVIALIGSLWTVFVFYDKWKDGNDKMRADITTLTQSEKSHNKTDSLILDRFDKLEGKVVVVVGASGVHDKEIKGLKGSILRYISRDEALSKEDFMRFIQEINGDSTIIYAYPYLMPKSKFKKIKP